MQRARFMGTVAENHSMERKWCEKLRQAMSRVEKRKSIATARAVERDAKRQCKNDKRQTEALLVKARYWRAHVFDPNRADLVTCKAALRRARARNCLGTSACPRALASRSASRRA